MDQELDQQRVGERHGASLGRAEPADIDAADHQKRQGQREHAAEERFQESGKRERRALGVAVRHNA
jgi:hypothetical protein